MTAAHPEKPHRDHTKDGVMLRNFSWIIPGQLAGMGLPTGAYNSTHGGNTAELEKDILELKKSGIASVVSLTGVPIQTDVLTRNSMRGLHVPIPDMMPPTVRQIRQCMQFIDDRMSAGGVVIHCTAGIGRTGTMLAGYLVWQGADPDQAIGEVRRLRIGSIETAEQEAAVHYFAQNLKQDNKGNT